MWRVIKIISVLVFLLAPFTARAEEPKDFKCVCDYKSNIIYSDGTVKCNKEALQVDLGGPWHVDGIIQNGEEFETVETKGLFLDKEQCPNLLEEAFKQKAICGEYYTCNLEAYVLVKEGQATPTFFWLPWYDLKWKTINTKDSPVVVKEGEIGIAEVVVSGATNLPIKIDCLNCGEYGAVPKQSGNKLKITLDTSKGDWLTKFYVMQVRASVGDADKAEDGALFGDVYFAVEGVASVPTTSTVDAWIESQYGVPPGYVEHGGVLPPCAFSGTCRSVNKLLELIINFASGMFVVLGSFAFAFFVYGGFKMILSMGNAEKVKSGRDTMIAAALGLVVAILAYAAIDFMLEILDVSKEFRGIK